MKYITEELNNHVFIRFGVHAKDDPEGDISVVQVKDIWDGSINTNNIIRMRSSNLKERDFLRKGDVLFSGKGRLVAIKWNEEIPEAVASNSFFIIQGKNGKILPGFLAAYLGSESVKKEIGRKTKSSTVMHLSIEDVRQLQIPIPPLDVQKKFVRLAELLQEEKKMNRAIISKKEKILDNLL